MTGPVSSSPLRVAARALAYAWPLRFQLAVNALLQMSSIFWILVLPWPAKVILDRIVLGDQPAPTGATTPFFFRPILALTEGLDAAQTVAVMGPLLLLMLVMVGAFGTEAGQRTAASGGLAEGQDSASRSENSANAMNSLLGGAYGLFEARWQLFAVHKLNHRLRASLFARYLAQPLHLHSGRAVGGTVFSTLYDSPTATGVVFNLWIGPATSLVNLTTTILLMFLVFRNEPLVVWCALAVAPLNFILTLVFAALVRRYATREREAGAALTAVIEEQATNILAVQALSSDADAETRFARASTLAFRRFRQAALVAILGSFTTTFVGASMIFAVLWFAAPAFIAGRLAPGDWVVIWGYYGAIAASADYLGKLWLTLQQYLAGMGRVFDVLDSPIEPGPGPGPALPPLRTSLTLDGVSYAYPGGKLTLQDIRLDIRVGEMTAIVGPSGAGKTTLAFLLPGLLTPTKGRLLVDGEPVGPDALDRLRRQTAFVFQEASLFDVSLAENIRMSRPEATDAEVREAASLAGILDFIDTLPEGFATRVGRSGSRLSLGQKQRVSIARALVSQRPVIVLDEPTAALDPETERRLAADLLQARRDRAVVVVAHRLSTIRAADQIVFLEDGRIRETGRHEDLVAAGGPYARFLSLQTTEVSLDPA